jgi:Holliday junction resolvase-like predicted endonuclease
LRRLEGISPQERGASLNRLIADVLDCYGIAAKPSVRGVGEIDVAFSLGGTRFILEAKWEQVKTDEGKLAKLQKRVSQRLETTLGVFLSMSGYTQEAIRGVSVGQRQNVLLLDRRHFEAMLAGIVPPDELFNLLIDKSSYEGGTYYQLEQLFPLPMEPPSLQLGIPEAANYPIEVMEPGIAVEPYIYDLPVSDAGLACTPKGNLVLSYPDGLVEFNPYTLTAKWVAGVTNCGQTVTLTDGSVYFGRQFGLGVIRNEKIEALAGGFSGSARLFLTPSGEVLSLDHGGHSRDIHPLESEGENVSIVRLGRSLNEAIRTTTNLRGSYVGDAIAVDDNVIAAIGGASLEIIDSVTGESTRRLHGLTNTFSIERYNEEWVLLVADGKMLAMMSLDGTSVLPLVKLGLNGALSGLCSSPRGDYYMYSLYNANGTQPICGVVVRFQLPTDLQP